MGEIAEMMLDGTMDPETGEFNFDGEDGPGWPMTAAEAAAYKRGIGFGSRRRPAHRRPAPPPVALSAKVRAKVQALGELRQNDPYHFQVRRDGKVVADWWPHRSKYRIANATLRGNEGDFVRALAKHLQEQPA